jgi:hypothetical protein
VSDAFDERLERTREDIAKRAADLERAQAERARSSEQARQDAAAAARALLPELLASFEALREFEEADPARMSNYKIYRTKMNLGFFPDSAPVTFSREYLPVRGLGKGSHLQGWIFTAVRGGLSITVPRSPTEPLVIEPYATLEEAADAGIYASSGRVVVTSQAFEAIIQTIVDHIARGH